MIEVERKFHLSLEQEKHLLEGASFDSTKSLVDSYYDNEFHRLTVSNRWLRKRGDDFDLKVPITKKPLGASRTTKYTELDKEDQIRAALGLEPSGASFEDDLTEAGFSQFCLARSIRRTYFKEGFTIALDTVNYDGITPTFRVAEIEKLVDSEAEVPAAEEAVLQFASQHGLPIDGVVLGKVPFYLQHKDPAHLALLMANKVFA